MADYTTTFSELVGKRIIEIGAGRPRTVSLNGHDLPILRVADVLDGRIESASCAGGPDEDNSGEQSKVSRPGDVVLTTKGTVGRVAIMPDGGPAFAYSPQLCYFRPAAASPLRSRFLYYWFKSTEFWNQANALKGQTDMADFLSLADIQLMRINIPPVSQQDAIVGVLGALDDKVAANSRLVAVSDQLSSAQLSMALDNTRVSLASISTVTMGSSPPGTSYNDRGEGIPFYQGVRDFGVRSPIKRVWTSAPVRLANKGDTLVSVRAPVGRTNIADEAMCIGRGLAALRSLTGNNYTLFHQIRAARGAWAPYEAEGTVFGSINKKQLEGIEVPAIRNGCEIELEAQISTIERRVAAALQESHFLARTRDELLPLLMSGRIRVRDAAKFVEEVV